MINTNPELSYDMIILQQKYTLFRFHIYIYDVYILTFMKNKCRSFWILDVTLKEHSNITNKKMQNKLVP